jgi:hypothetical protein
MSVQASCSTYPYILTNGTTADATQVMADFDCVLVNPTFAGSVGIGVDATHSNFQVLSDMAVTNGSGLNGEFTVIATTTGPYSIMRNAAGAATIVFDGRGPDSSFINNGGSFGVGTDSPGAKIDVGGSLRVGAINGSNGTSVSSNAASIVLGGRGDTEGSVSFVELGDNAHAASRNFALANGYGGGAGLLSIYGSSTVSGNPFSGIWLLSLDAGGNLTIAGDGSKPGGGSWSTPSDERLKEKIVPIGGNTALEKIAKLKPVTFEWRNARQHAEDKDPGGFIAQNMQTVFPEFVASQPCTSADCITLGSKTASEYYLHLPIKFDAYLVASIQELAKKSAMQRVTLERDAAVVSELRAKFNDLKTASDAQVVEINVLRTQPGLKALQKQVSELHRIHESDTMEIGLLKAAVRNLQRSVGMRTARN